jgi:hypothetical protein
MPVLPGADIHGFYQRLGIRLPTRTAREASIRCFADPDAHRRDDRDPSCSVNLENGAFNCHACGACGGAYDAAIAVGHTARSAIDLMIEHGLIERRARLRTASELPTARPTLPARTRLLAVKSFPAPPATFGIREHDIHRYVTQLERRPALIARLARDRGWTTDAIEDLELGYDRGRITIPARNAGGQLRGLLRYQPDDTSRPKMLAAPGTRNGLIPHPVAERSPSILLVEGPPDMVAARSRGLPAIAVPGTEAWQPGWAPLLASRHVTIVMDADPAGRSAAYRIARDLDQLADVEIHDLAPNRNDGYDLTDWLLEHATAHQLAELGADVTT